MWRICLPAIATQSCLAPADWVSVIANILWLIPHAKTLMVISHLATTCRTGFYAPKWFPESESLPTLVPQKKTTPKNIHSQKDDRFSEGGQKVDTWGIVQLYCESSFSWNMLYLKSASLVLQMVLMLTDLSCDRQKKHAFVRHLLLFFPQLSLFSKIVLIWYYMQWRNCRMHWF